MKGEHLLHSALLLAAAACLAGAAPSTGSCDGGSCCCDTGDSCCDSCEGFYSGGPWYGPYPGFGGGPWANCGWGPVAGAYGASGWWCPPGCDCGKECCLKRLCSHFHHHHHADDNQPNWGGPPPGWYGDACWDNYAGGGFGPPAGCPSCGHGCKHSCAHHGGCGHDGCGEKEHCLKKLCSHFHHKAEGPPPGCGPWGCGYPPGTYFGGYISEGCDDCWGD